MKELQGGPDFISEALDMEERQVIPLIPKNTNLVPKTDAEFAARVDENEKEDYTEVRDNIKHAIANVETIVEASVTEVQANPSARMLETFSLLVKTYAELNKDLMTLHKGCGKPGIEAGGDVHLQQNNIAFQGETDSVIDMLKARQ